MKVTAFLKLDVQNNTENIRKLSVKVTLYSPNAKNPQKRLVYQEVVRMLKSGIPIKQIAEKNAITRSTVYRIKKELVE